MLILCKPYFFYRKFFAVKIIKNTCVGVKWKFKFIAVKCLILNVIRCFSVFSVFSIAHKRMTDICHMRSYLMRSACQKFNFRKTVFAVEIKNFIFCYNFFWAVNLFTENFNFILRFVFNKIIVKNIAIFFRFAVQQAKIVFFKFSCFDFGIENPQTFGIFCRNYYTARVSVNSVCKSGSECFFFFWVVFALIIKIVLNSCHKRIKW